MIKSTTLRFLVSACATFMLWQLAFASSKSSLQRTKNGVLEVVMLSTKPSYTSKQVIKRAASVSTILKSYPGFISRRFSKNTAEKNQWIDIVHWDSLHDALVAANNIVKVAQMKKFISVIKTYKMYHFQIKLNTAHECPIKNNRLINNLQS